MTSRMFPFITHTWNPLGGACEHNCYEGKCWAQELTRKYHMEKYIGPSRLITKELSKEFKKGDFVFVQDMNDLFGDWVYYHQIMMILDTIRTMPETNFLLLTKNPQRYWDFINVTAHDVIPTNCILGATIESDYEMNLGKAPKRKDRLKQIGRLKIHNELREIPYRLFISIEPIMDFNAQIFPMILTKWIKPWAVAVGYDNYKCKLKEPTIAKTEKLIAELERAKIKVYRKTIRESWEEKKE